MLVGYSLLLVVFFEIFLALRFLFGYQRSLSVLFFGLSCFSTSIYVGVYGIGYIGGIITNGVWERLTWTGAVFATAFFLPFSYSFPPPLRSARELLPWILWPTILFVGAVLATNLIITTGPDTQISSGYALHDGPYFYLIVVFLIFYWSWAITNLVRSKKRGDGIHITVPLTVPSDFGYVGSLMTTVWVGYTTYILYEK